MRSDIALLIYALTLSPHSAAAACIFSLWPLGTVKLILSYACLINSLLYFIASDFSLYANALTPTIVYTFQRHCAMYISDKLNEGTLCNVLIDVHYAKCYTINQFRGDKRKQLRHWQSFRSLTPRLRIRVERYEEWPR